MEQKLPAFITLKEDRFTQSKVQIGEVFINTHGSAATIRDWCKRVAGVANIQTSEFEFIN